MEQPGKIKFFPSGNSFPPSSRQGTLTFPDHPLTEEIVKYNEIDCKVLQEILEHNRQNHIHPQDEDLFENRDSIESFSEDSLDEEYDRIFKKRKID